MCLEERKHVCKSENRKHQQKGLCSPQLLRDSKAGSQKESKGSHLAAPYRLSSATTAILLSVSLPATLLFSLQFPHILSRKAVKYYLPSAYTYSEEDTLFDNSAGTYATDYIITVFMVFGSIQMFRKSVEFKRDKVKFPHFCHLECLCLAAGSLLGSYAVSVLCGGISHQFFTTVASMNTVTFRVVWTLTVGTVALAGGLIGYIGSCLGRYFYATGKLRYDIAILPGWFWGFWGLGMTASVVVGWMSFYRPACDIFIAGTTQIYPTVYSVLVLVSRRFSLPDREVVIQAKKSKAVQAENSKKENLLTDEKRAAARLQASGERRNAPVRFGTVNFEAVEPSTCAIFIFAFFANAPLLPLYPELLWAGLGLGLVNTMLHCWLCLTWGLQYLSLKQICESQQLVVANLR